MSEQSDEYGVWRDPFDSEDFKSAQEQPETELPVDPLLIYKDINPPPKCADCPFQSELVRKITELTERKTNLVNVGYATIDKQTDQPYEDTNQRAKELLGKYTANRLSKLDEAIEKHKSSGSMSSLACKGILTMRAADEDTIYTTTICRSPYVLESTSGYVPTHIRTKPSH